MPTKAKKNVFLVVQEGGSSTEIYLHGFNTAKQADKHRLSCANAAYRTSPVIEVPLELESQPGFYDAAQKILRASLDVSYPS